MKINQELCDAVVFTSLFEKLPVRELALRFGVSRGTIAVMLNGRWKAKKRSVQTELRKDRFVTPTGRYVRCPCCGAIAQMPCLSCFYENGEVYPESVWNTFLHPEPVAAFRRCISCGKTKPIVSFGKEVSTSAAIAMRYSTCVSCRIALLSIEKRRMDSSSQFDYIDEGEYRE